MKRLPKFVCPAILVVMLLIPPNANSCGPFFSDAIFTFELHPAAPLKQYAEGNLGVILPTFARSYLVVAYRHLSGRPLTRSETQGALNYWLWKLQGGWTRPPADPTREWAAARAQIMGALDEPGSLASYGATMSDAGFVDLTCQADAFHTAALTLKDRIRRFGAGSPELREWIHGQDAVFSNCNGRPNIPPVMNERSSSLLKADRRYQIAAAHFYSGQLGAAIQDFDRISKDNSSPWHVLASYIAARIIVRRGSPHDGDTAFLIDAQTRLQIILRDKSRTVIHPAARKLLGLVEYRLDPDKRIHELARLLAGPHPDPNFEQDLIDYTFGLDRWVGDEPLFWEPDDTPEKTDARRLSWKQKRFRELSKFALNEEMTDWILTMQQSGEAGRSRALKRWHDHHSLPWLVAAISKIDASDKNYGELTQAAEKAEPDSPSYPTIVYHRVRLLLQAGELERARTLLNQILPNFETRISSSSFNLFLQQRLKVATTFQDFLHYSTRHSVGEGGGESESGDDWLDCGWHKNCEALLYSQKAGRPLESRFDVDAALILNTRLPLELLARAVGDDKLPSTLRGELSISTWTRAAMLGQHDIAAALAPEVEKIYPVMKADLEHYKNAKTPEDQWHAALLTILHFPGARPYVNARSGRRTPIQKIDNYRDNWWCSDLGSEADQPNYVKDYDKSHTKEQFDAPGYPQFLSPEQINAAKSEWKTLFVLGRAADYLPEQTLKWAKEKPNDPRIPEALHYAVRTTRYSCDGGTTSKLSRQAFKLLHSRYPNSRWAKETPFWF